MAYNVNPTARNWAAAYGGIPGNIDLPDPLADLEAVNPQIKPQLSKAYNTIGSQLIGELDPTTLAQIQDDAARWGLMAGTPTAPGSMGAARGFWNNVRTREQQKQLGLQNYGNLTGLVDQTMTLDPALQAQIAESNAIKNAAPIPESASKQQKADYWNALNRALAAAGGGRGGGGGTRVTWGDPSLPNLRAAGLGGSAGGGGVTNAWGTRTDPIQSTTNGNLGPNPFTGSEYTKRYGYEPSGIYGNRYDPLGTAPSWTPAGGAGGLSSYIDSVLNTSSRGSGSGRDEYGLYSYSPSTISGPGGGYYDTPPGYNNPLSPYIAAPESTYGTAPEGGGLGAVDNTIDVGWGNLWEFPTEPANYVEDPWLDSIYGG